MKKQEQFIIDADGNKTSVILPLKKYEKLMEDMRDLAILAERCNEVPINLEEMKRRLESDGFSSTGTIRRNNKK